MARWLLWSALLACFVAAAARADSPAGAVTAAVPNPMQPAAAAAAAPGVPNGCGAPIASAMVGAPSDVVVALDADTLWRPPQAQVRFTIAGTTGTPPRIRRVSACFAWLEAASGVGSKPNPAPSSGPIYMPSQLVSSVPNTDGPAEYGALVPPLPDADARGAVATGRVARTGLGLVPVAAMQVLVELDDPTHPFVAVVLPVGITSIWLALAVLAVCLLVLLSALLAWVPGILLPEHFTTRRRELGLPSRRNLGARLRVGLAELPWRLLGLVSTARGVADLSQFQIMLWSVTVAGAAVYVMVLSGNLVTISSGTLTLLGIAGAASLLARGPAPARELTCRPQWSQLLRADPETPEIDVTRVQMLIFTLISAAFVALKVATSYTIPEIPANFQLLMGISNGVYIAGSHLQGGLSGRLPDTRP